MFSQQAAGRGIERLLQIDTLHQRVIGQDDAVRAISGAVRRARAGTRTPNAYQFLHLPRPTGVRKTELAGALAEASLGGRL